MKILKRLNFNEIYTLRTYLDKNYAKLAFDSFACFLSFVLLACFLPKASDLSSGWMIRYGFSYAFITLGILVILRTHKSTWSLFSARQGIILLFGLSISTLVFAALIFMNAFGVQLNNTFFIQLLGIASAGLFAPRLLKTFVINRLDILGDKENSFMAPTNVLFLGTSKAINTVSQNFLKSYNPLGIISETRPMGEDFQGYEILGKINDLPEIFESFNSQGLHPHHLVLSSTNITGKKLRKLVLENYQHVFTLKKLSSRSSTSKNFFEDLAFEDLFSHSSYFDPESSLGDYFAQKSILILGAGSHLGQKLCKILSKLPIKNLVLCDGQHNSLSDLQDLFMKNTLPFEHHFVLTYGYDHEKYEQLISTQRPDFIFYLDNIFESQVAQSNPLETISENILIPQGLIELAERYQTKALAYVIQTPINPEANLSLTTSLITAAYAQGLDRSKKLNMRIIPIRVAPLIAHDHHLIHQIDMQLDQDSEIKLSQYQKELSITDGNSAALFLLKTLFIEMDTHQARGETIAEHISDTVLLQDFIYLRAKYNDPNLTEFPKINLTKLKESADIFGICRTVSHHDTTLRFEQYKTSLESMNELLRELIGCFADYDKERAQKLIHENWTKLLSA